mgnify:CR=1 FL=1
MDNVTELWKSIVRLAVKQARQVTDDKEALAIKVLYKQWIAQLGRTLEVGEYVQHDGELYRVLQQHVAQGNWIPGMGTESLYMIIDREHEGTLEDPIPWRGNMECFLGKYYIEDGILYECIRDSGIALQYKVIELIDNYFVVYNKNIEDNENIENGNENIENGNENIENGNENNEGENIENPKDNSGTTEPEGDNNENIGSEPTEPEIEETEVGTIENPIDVTNATLPVVYELDKYYKEGEVVYKCTRAETLHFLPSSLVGHYFEIV